MFGRLSLTEILLIVLALALLFGAKRLPLLGRSLGEAISNFVREIKGRGGKDTPELPPQQQPPEDTKKTS